MKNEFVPEIKLAAKPVKEAEKNDDKQKQEIDTRTPPFFPQSLQKQKDDAKCKKF